MLRAPGTPPARRDASASGSPASAHALLSLMQSVAPQTSVSALESPDKRQSWWPHRPDGRGSAPQHPQQLPASTGTASSSSSLASSPVEEFSGDGEAKRPMQRGNAPPDPPARGQGSSLAHNCVATKTPASKKPSATKKTVSRKKVASQDDPPKPKKVRKRTYYMRKEEMARLTEEMATLQEQLGVYKHRAEVLAAREAVYRRDAYNRTLATAIYGQRLAFASTQSMISQFMRVQEHSPFETFIQLGSDPVERHATLLAMKQRKLHDALQFLVARRRFMDPSASFSDHQKFDNAHGDFCSLGFDITPFEGVRSARTVFDVLLNFSYNLEISISELVGDITIRENDDHWDPSVSQQRLVTNISDAVQMETNNVMFSEYHERNGVAALGVQLPQDGEDLGSQGHGDEVGVLAIDFVNEDEQFPYHPERCIRQDVTVLMLVSTCTRPKRQQSPSASGEPEMEHVVVLTRWSLLRIRKSKLQLSDTVTQRIRGGIEQVGDAMLNNVRYALAPRAISSTTSASVAPVLTPSVAAPVPPAFTASSVSAPPSIGLLSPPGPYTVPPPNSQRF